MREIADGIKAIDIITEVKKDQFYNILESQTPLLLEIMRIGKLYNDKYDKGNRDGQIKKRIAIDYKFKLDNKFYKCGIHYNLGYEVEDGTEVFNLGNRTDLFNILKYMFPAIAKEEKIQIEKSILNKLIGRKFLATAETINGINQDYKRIKVLEIADTKKL